MFILDRFNGLKALVVGDVMIDAYSKGFVERMSPEAPVPIVSLKEHFDRLGGAANVALNLKALDAVPFVCSVIGNDTAGERLYQLMREHDLNTDGLVRSKQRSTTVKHRVFDRERQLLRIDEEDTFDLNEEERFSLLAKIDEQMRQERIDVIILQDYNKGVLSPAIIKHLLEVADSAGIPVVVDPKKNNFFAYEGVTLFKPNAKELCDGLGVTAETIDELRQAANSLQERLRCQYLMVTLSEKGVMILHDNTFLHLAAHPRHIVDVSGAGDTVLSVAALCLASYRCARHESSLGNVTQKTIGEAIATLSNIAGGMVCESSGVVPIDKARFKEEIKRLYHG